MQYSVFQLKNEILLLSIVIVLCFIFDLNLFLVYELARTVVEVAADTWRRAGSLCLDTTNSDTVPPMSSLGLYTGF